MKTISSVFSPWQGRKFFSAILEKPLFKNRAIAFHLLFWLGIYLLWIIVFRGYSLTLRKTMTVEFCYLIFITADFYLVNNLLVPRLFLKNRFFTFAIATIAVISVSAWLRYLLAAQMSLYFFHAGPVRDTGKLYLDSFINISLWVLLVMAAKLAANKIKSQQHLELLEKERIKNELDFLKAQINPHALFNSLNTIYGYIDKGNQDARNVLLQYSGLLRYQLYDCGAEKVPLEKEVAYIRNYIAFQQLRKDGNLKVCVDTEEVQPGMTIAPLMLVVLIENAFKFVSNFSDQENRISVRMCTSDLFLHCTIINTKEMEVPAIDGRASGIGIQNLRRRLELLYPGKYELETRIENELYESKLSLHLL